MPVAAPGPLPILVGVTGHTDLRPEDLAVLVEKVTEVLTTLRSRYPHSSVVVLSALAEGADRLVANVALDLGMRLVVPLPLEPDDYQKDFADPASVAAFQTLLARAERQFVVPEPTAAARTRPHCYARAGAYVARHCHVLLALWNGHQTEKIGGTGHSVRYRLDGMAPEFAGTIRLLDSIENGVVYQIVTPRRSDPSTHGAPFHLRILKPERHGEAGSSDGDLEQVCRGTDDFNAVASQSTPASAALSALPSLLPQYGPDALPAELQAIRALHEAADRAAIGFQRRTLRTLRSLFVLAFGIVVAFEVFAHGPDLVPQLRDSTKLAIYLLMLGAGFLVYRWAEAHEIDKKYLDYRALAEALRVDFYWRVAHVKSSAADHCIRFRLEEMEWIRLALRSCDVTTAGLSWPDTPEASVAALRTVVEDWVRGQHAYFGRTQRRLHGLLGRLERRVNWLFAVSFAAGLVVAGLTFRVSARVLAFGERHPITHPLALAILGLSPAAAALVHGYAEQRALSVQIKRYERMHALFGKALHVLDTPMAAGDWDAARDVLTELGREALEENADWVMLHRDRPIELPA